MILTHSHASKAAKIGIFSTVNSMEDLRTRIRESSDNIPLNVPPQSYNPEEDEPFDFHQDRKVFRGNMFEVFVEYFLNAMSYDKDIGVIDAKPVPLERDFGVDFTGKSTRDDSEIAVQCKFKSNPNHVFSFRELATFMATASNLHGANSRNQILITTAVDSEVRPVLYHTVKIVNPKMRVIDWTRLKSKVDNNRGFWDGFRSSLEESKIVPKTRSPRIPYDYQQEAISSIGEWFK